VRERVLAGHQSDDGVLMHWPPSTDARRRGKKSDASPAPKVGNTFFSCDARKKKERSFATPAGTNQRLLFLFVSLHPTPHHIAPSRPRAPLLPLLPRENVERARRLTFPRLSPARLIFLLAALPSPSLTTQRSPAWKGKEGGLPVGKKKCEGRDRTLHGKKAAHL